MGLCFKRASETSCERRHSYRKWRAIATFGFGKCATVAHASLRAGQAASLPPAHPVGEKEVGGRQQMVQAKQGTCPEPVEGCFVTGPQGCERYRCGRYP